MSETIEQAREGMEHAHHAATPEHDDHAPRRVAILIAVLAACLALTEMGEKAAQSEYLTHHISVSDTYAFAQAKKIRGTTYATAADIIESTPNLDDAARQRVARLRAEATRMSSDPATGEGSKQLVAKAREVGAERDHAFHVYHQFERATGALQIAIVLASVSIVTRVRALTYLAATMGLLAATYGALVATGAV